MTSPARFLAKFIRIQHAFMFRHDLGPVPDAAVQIADLQIRTFFVPCELAQYESWVNEGVDIPSLPQAKPYDGQTDEGTIVFWTTLGQIRVGCTAVSTQSHGTVYAKVLPKLHAAESSGTVVEGLNETSPQFRRKGVFAWQQAHQLRFLTSHGFQQRFSLEPAEQEGPRRVQERNGAVLIGEVCLVEFPAFVRSAWRFSRWTANLHLVRALRGLSHRE